MMGKAAVIGGGIGGLAVAGGLMRCGWDVTVFERRAALEETGTGLGIWPSALAALDEIGLGGRAREIGRRQADGAIRRPDGSVIARIEVSRHEVYLLSRPVLLRLLASQVKEVQFGQSMVDVPELAGQFDVVIGADGIRSAVRRSMFGDRFGLRYAGMVTWRGTVDLDVPAGGEIWGVARKFGFTPQEPGRTNWYVAMAAPPGSRDALPDFAGWCDPVPRILSLVSKEDMLRHDLDYLEPLPAYVKGNVALLGDAAHAMTPDLGQGACQALIDAAALAQCLGDGADVESALAQYDRRRRPATQRLAAMSARANRLAQMRRFIGLRNAMVRAALAFGPPG